MGNVGVQVDLVPNKTHFEMYWVFWHPFFRKKAKHGNPTKMLTQKKNGISGGKKKKVNTVAENTRVFSPQFLLRSKLERLLRFHLLLWSGLFAKSRKTWTGPHCANSKTSRELSEEASPNKK